MGAARTSMMTNYNYKIQLPKGQGSEGKEGALPEIPTVGRVSPMYHRLAALDLFSITAALRLSL